jgi:uncharacterized membrane protein
MTITPKPQNQKPKYQNSEETFWFSLKGCICWFSLCFFLFCFDMQKPNKNRLFFCDFLQPETFKKQKNTRYCLVFAFQNTKKTQGKQKTSFGAKKISSKFCFLIFWFCVCFVFFFFW